jgi:hypothetical protein
MNPLSSAREPGPSAEASSRASSQQLPYGAVEFTGTIQIPSNALFCAKWKRIPDLGKDPVGQNPIDAK